MPNSQALRKTVELSPAVLKEVRPAYRRAVMKDLHLKQTASVEKQLTDVLVTVIQDQVDEIVVRLRAMKSTKDTAGSVVQQALKADKWKEELVNAAFPVLASHALKTVAAQFLSMGVNLKQKPIKHLMGQHDQHTHGRDDGVMAPDTGGQFGGGGSAVAEKPPKKPSKPRKPKEPKESVAEDVNDRVKPVLENKPGESERSSLKYARADEKDLPVITGTGRKLKKGRKITVGDVGNFLNEENAQRGKAIEHTDKNRQVVAKALTEEAKYAVEKRSEAIGWYDENLRNMFGVMKEIHPELSKDQDKAALFKILLAINSNGQQVDPNFDRANELYTKWKESGRLEVDGIFGGKNQTVINKQLVRLQKMIDDFGGAENGGLKKMREFLEMDSIIDKKTGEKRPLLVRDLKEMGYTVTGEQVSTEVRGAMIFGPKLGSFFGNMNGDFSTVTMDRWFMRTYGRIAGTLTDKGTSKKTLKKHGAKFEKMFTDMEDESLLHGYSRKELIAEAKRLSEQGTVDDSSVLFAWAKKRESVYGAGDYKDKSEVNKSAKSFYQTVHGMREAPRGGKDRQWIRTIMREVQQNLKNQGFNITMADIQAVLWYYEKQMYTKLGYKGKGDETIDYYMAALALKERLKQKK